MFTITPLIAFVFGIAAGALLLAVGMLIFNRLFDGLEDFER